MSTAINTSQKNEELGFIERVTEIPPYKFMKKEMQLRNTELRIYSIIYNFAEEGESYDKGLNFLTKLTNSSYSSVKRGITSLINKDYIKKSTEFSKHPEYNVNISALPRIPMFRHVHELNDEELLPSDNKN